MMEQTWKRPNHDHMRNSYLPNLIKEHKVLQESFHFINEKTKAELVKAQLWIKSTWESF